METERSSSRERVGNVAKEKNWKWISSKKEHNGMVYYVNTIRIQ